MPRAEVLEPETLTIVGDACLAAWDGFKARHGSPNPAVKAEIQKRFALRIMRAVADGERDPERLVELALRELDA